MVQDPRVAAMADKIKSGRPKMKLNIKEGALHKQLGVPPDEKIPAGKLAVHAGDSALEKKRKILAENMSHWHHGG
jgi:hypothetical protein